VTNEQISKMKQIISDMYDSYTIVYELPHLRKQATTLTNKTLEEYLYYSIVIDSDDFGYLNFEFSFFSDELLMFNGLETIQLN